MQKTNLQVKLVAESLAYYFIEKHWEFLEEDEIRHLLSRVDLNRLSDQIIVDNIYIRNQIDWDKIPRNKLLRCASRFIDINEIDYVIDIIQLPKRNIAVSEVMHLAIRRPNIIEVLGIDLKSISQKEAYELLLLGANYFLEHIDIEKFKFDYHQAFNISKTYQHKIEVLKRLPYHKFNNLQISQVISEHGEEVVNFFDLNKLTPIDWIYILERRPETYEFMDPIIFLETDVYELVRLLEIFDYEELHVIMKHKYKELTSYGIERLIIAHYQYHEIVDLSKLNKNNIAMIQKHHPYFQY